MSDHEDLQKYVGRKAELTDVITASQVQRLNATLDRDDPMPKAGDLVPPGWQCIFFPKTVPMHRLGFDGMVPEMENGPPDPLELRLFGASRAKFLRPLRIGEEARLVTELASMTAKEGRSGRLVFATYRHTISTQEGVATVEEWDIVFRDKPKGDAAKPPPGKPAPGEAAWGRTLTPSSATLFRFSAVTFNSHRVHYDQPYATGTEGYPGLMVQAPLTAIWLLELAREHHPAATVSAFEMRALAPLFSGEAVRLMGRPSEDGRGCELWAAGPAGTLAMAALARFA